MPLPDRCVLLVDDDEDFLLLWRLVLAGDGRFPCVVSTTQPEDVVDRLDVLQPAVILSDMYMPVLSGADLARAVRSRRPSIPVILTSAAHGAESEAISCGAAAFIDKSRTTADALPALIIEVLEAADSACA